VLVFTSHLERAAGPGSKKASGEKPVVAPENLEVSERMCDVAILFLHLIVTVVRLAASVVAPNAPGNVGESVIENAG
jgi:hypothetical protein